MNYAEGIEWLKEHDVRKDDGTFYEFGEVRTHYQYHFKRSVFLDGSKE